MSAWWTRLQPSSSLALLWQDERKRKKKEKEEWEDEKKESKEFRMGGGVVVQMEEVRGNSSIPLRPPLSFSSCFFPPPELQLDEYIKSVKLLY